ncbi:MAG: hypothetical protein RLZZ399_1149 [Verrucomicrobiota bacterium]|jgi:hypothetical protein
MECDGANAAPEIVCWGGAAVLDGAAFADEESAAGLVRTRRVVLTLLAFLTAPLSGELAELP